MNLQRKSSAIVTIARSEIELWARDRLITSLVVITLVSSIVAAITGAIYADRLQKERETASEVSRRQWEAQGPKNPHSAAHFGVYAFQPLGALASFDPGTTPFSGTAVYLEAHVQNEAILRPAEDATELELFGEANGAALLRIVAPLLLLFMVFGAIAGERERGRWHVLLTSGATPAQLVLGKALASIVLIPLLLIPTFGAVLLFEGVHGTDELLRLVLLFALYFLYLSVFSLFTLAVSAWTATSRRALAIALCFWAATAILLPRLAAGYAAEEHVLPSSFELHAELRRELKDGEEEQLAALKERVLREHDKAKLEELPFNFDALAMQEGEEHGNRVFDRRFGRVWDTMEQQHATERAFGWASPSIALEAASMVFSGSDFAHHRAFLVAAERYRRDLVRAMNEDMRLHSRTGDWSYAASEKLWKTVPPFEWQAPQIGEMAGAALPSLIALLFWALFALAAALAGARRTS